MNQHRAEYAALRERVKELTCLYSLAQLAARPGATLEQIFQGSVELLPAAWQYPEVAAARIVFDGHAYVTAGFREDCHKQAAAIVLGGQPRGVVEVVYTEPRPEWDEGPFLKEERSLIDAVARQITLIIERRQAEDEQLRLRGQLRHADRLATIGQLAAGVAHELNEPLGNILGFAQLLRKHRGLPEQVGQDLDRIVAACLHARQIITNLMLFSRQMPPQKAPVDLNATIEEALGFLEARCARSGIAVVRELSPDLPRIWADASQLRQVFVNLVVNAIHAMRDGGALRVSTGRTERGVLLRVADNGVGMTEEVLEQIFTPFFTTRDVSEGTGLGLPVAHGIVTSHGGTIRVDSVVGRGTRFDVELPPTGAGEDAGAVQSHGKTG